MSRPKKTADRGTIALVKGQIAAVLMLEEDFAAKWQAIGKREQWAILRKAAHEWKRMENLPLKKRVSALAILTESQIKKVVREKLRAIVVAGDESMLTSHWASETPNRESHPKGAPLPCDRETGLTRHSWSQYIASERGRHGDNSRE